MAHSQLVITVRAGAGTSQQFRSPELLLGLPCRWQESRHWHLNQYGMLALHVGSLACSSKTLTPIKGSLGKPKVNWLTNERPNVLLRDLKQGKESRWYYVITVLDILAVQQGKSTHAYEKGSRKLRHAYAVT